ncbi:hypothetical protein [Cupriavidus sp. D39]|uniref:hypothetical protein n=1 Tax=Cupriavidus sp. D39 TaxID=2997877 RepID=UPI00226F469F|nr:hypothetical protein [Cupriavidus sp. D39]MCY0852893.1 hypothetical protein [Cupriavidus sp. D39]
MKQLMFLPGDFVENGKALGLGMVLFWSAGTTHGPRDSEKGARYFFLCRGSLI